MPKLDKPEHRLLTLWAADCAERVLPAFESTHHDDRPRLAIEAARAWARGVLSVSEARRLAFGAHAAARAAEGPGAIAAARAAGHAAATAHVPTHARYAAAYALKATADPLREKEWQSQQLSASLPSFVP